MSEMPKMSRVRWTVCALLFFASTVNYIDRQTLSVLKPHLQQLMHWSETDYGWIVFAFQLAYAIMMVVSGKVVDRLGFSGRHRDRCIRTELLSMAQIGHSPFRAWRLDALCEAGVRCPMCTRELFACLPPSACALPMAVRAAGMIVKVRWRGSIPK